MAAAGRLKYGVQSYAWGKVGTASMVARLKAAADPDFQLDNAAPYAELWIGTHPKCPSSCDGAPLTAAPQLAAAGGDVPFLLKVLSINTALSIQAHPTLAHARELHARDPKNYPDPNHKPELIVALTPMSALVCFRVREEVAAYGKRHPTLAGCLAAAADAAVDEKEALRRIMRGLIETKGAAAAALIDAHVARLQQMPSGGLSAEDTTCIELSRQYPGDTGALMVYVLNLRQLRPGEGVFLAPNEPHAYLKGDGCEIMAKSDNVVRAGLTPKFRDAETLLGMMTYDPAAIQQCALSGAGGVYQPPRSVPEFQLTMRQLWKDAAGGRASSVTHSCHSPAVLFVVKGGVSYSGTSGSGQAAAGDAVLLPRGARVDVAVADPGAGAAGCAIDGDAVVFFAETNAAAQPPERSLSPSRM